MSFRNFCICPFKLTVTCDKIYFKKLSDSNVSMRQKELFKIHDDDRSRHEIQGKEILRQLRGAE